MSILASIVRIIKFSDLRNKIIFILGVFVLFRLMANIPIPGIDAERLQQFFSGNQLLGLLNLFTGGALDSLSIVMLGLGPYITGVIVMQLLTMIFPSLERLYKEEGEAGRAKFNQYGRLLTVPFALVQGYGFLALLVQQGIIGSLSPSVLVIALATMTGGTPAGPRRRGARTGRAAGSCAGRCGSGGSSWPAHRDCASVRGSPSAGTPHPAG